MTHAQHNHDPWQRRWPQLAGIGVLVAAVIVLLWPGSLLALGLGTLLATLTLLLIFTIALFLLLRGRRTR
jgi:hypothetical protein